MKQKRAKRKRTDFLKMVTAQRKYIFSVHFKNLSRKKVTDFTRNRKMPFTDMIMFMLNQIKASTQTELDGLFDLTGAIEKQMTQQSFSEARQKLRYEACRRALFDNSVETMYEGGFSTWHGFRVLAVDGTKLQLPSDPKLKAKFGTLGRGDTAVSAQSSCLFDVLNDMIMDARIAPVSTDERTLVQAHILSI